jgi:hypothetical protein
MLRDECEAGSVVVPGVEQALCFGNGQCDRAAASRLGTAGIVGQDRALEALAILAVVAGHRQPSATA